MVPLYFMTAANSAPADQALLDALWRNDATRLILPNGLTLLIKPDNRAALASVQVWVKSGSVHEDEFLGAGLSHYLEHMLFKGTKRRSSREITTEVQAHGGQMNAYTTFDRTVYHIDLPSEHLPVAVDVLADMVLHSTLPEEECVKEKEVILREIAMGQDDPDQRLGEALFATAFREHPYRYPIIGHREVFSAVTRSDLLAYYRARYVPNNLVVVVVGDVSVEEVQAEVQKHFGTTPRARLAPVMVPLEPAQLASRQWHRCEDVEISRGGVAWQIPGLTDEDTPALDVLSMILGVGDSSILWQRIREKLGLVHSIDATSWNPGSTGLFYISFTCDAAKREAVPEAIERELQKLRKTGITASQIEKAVRQLVVGEINSRKTMSGQASRLGVAEVVVGDLDFSRTYFARLAKLTTGDLKQVLVTYLNPANRTSVSLNPQPTSLEGVPTKTAAKLPRVGFEEITLPNGARLLLQPDHALPNVHLRLLGLGGPRYEAADRRGATALMTTLLTKDTQRRSAEAVARTIEEVGGLFYPVSGNNTFGLAVEVLPTDLDRALEILDDAVRRPAFRPATVKAEREAHLAGLMADQDDVVTVGGKLLRKRFFGRHPFAIDSRGDEAGIKATTVADLKAMHRQLVRAGNLVLAVSGDFDVKAITRKCRAFLASLPKGAVDVQGQDFSGPAEPGVFVETQPRQQAVVFEAYQGPSLWDPDFAVSDVMDELFSGMSSRLFERVRDDLGLAYFVRSSRVIGLDCGMFYFYAGTAPGSEGAVLREVAAEIKRVAGGGVTSEELCRCQTRLKSARRMGLQTNGSRAMKAALNALYGKPVNDDERYDAEIDAVTRRDLSRFAKKYFKRQLAVQLTVRP